MRKYYYKKNDNKVFCKVAVLHFCDRLLVLISDSYFTEPFQNDETEYLQNTFNAAFFYLNSFFGLNLGTIFKEHIAWISG